MRVVWGRNSLTDCAALLAWREQIVLRVLSSPLRVDLRTPQGLANVVDLDIQLNRVVTPIDAGAKVSETSNSVAVLWKNAPILMAQAIEDDTVLLHADLRPLGMNIFDDSEGLHVGGGLLAENTFRGCSTAIALE